MLFAAQGQRSFARLRSAHRDGARRSHLDSIAPGGLCAIKGPIGSAQQRIQVFLASRVG